MYNLVISSAATEMARQAYEWYDELEPGLGSKFLSELNEVYAKLIANPFLYSKRYNDVRDVMVSRFPYIVIYEVFGHEVAIYSIFHTSRKPKKKYRKL